MSEIKSYGNFLSSSEQIVYSNKPILFENCNNIHNIECDNKHAMISNLNTILNRHEIVTASRGAVLFNFKEYSKITIDCIIKSINISISLFIKLHLHYIIKCPIVDNIDKSLEKQGLVSLVKRIGGH